MVITAGLPTGSNRPVNSSAPVAALMWNEVIESPRLLHAKRNVPLGSMQILRGESACTQVSATLRS